MHYKTFTQYSVHHGDAIRRELRSAREARAAAALASLNGSDADVYADTIQVVDGLHVLDRRNSILLATYSGGRAVRARRAA